MCLVVNPLRGFTIPDAQAEAKIESNTTNLVIKGTVRVISSDPPCKYGVSRFTTVPFKALYEQA